MDMKKILLIGKFNTTTENMNRILGKYFQMQLGSDSPEMAIGILKMEVPDLILISTTAMEKSHREIFEYIKGHCLKVPVVCVGTSKEFEAFEDYFDEKQFYKVQRPVQMKTILGRIRLCLGTETEDATQDEKDGKEPLREALEERGKLLLVDDSKIQLRMLKSMLEKQYDVEVAESGEDAIRMLQRNIPDVIFLDYDMPGVDGKETFRRIREQEELANIPVVFLTGVTEKKRYRRSWG